MFITTMTDLVIQDNNLRVEMGMRNDDKFQPTEFSDLSSECTRISNRYSQQSVSPSRHHKNLFHFDDNAPMHTCVM